MSALSRNLRHLRLMLAVVDSGSLSAAAEVCNVSQPAVTRAMAGLEAAAGGALFQRGPQGMSVTERGAVLARRVRRALDLLDPGLDAVAPRLRLTATQAQLRALIAVHDAENFTLAARRLELAQPTVYRAISQLEREAGRALFERTGFGVIPTRQTRGLVQAVMLALAELAQADSDLADLDGGVAGRIVVGALPLARSVLLPRALVRFRAARPDYPVHVVDGPYDDLLAGLRRGEVDMIVGALRDPAPIEDVTQEALFDDRLAVLAGRAHPLAGQAGLTAAQLRGWKWVVPRRGTPSRAQFDAFFAEVGPPDSIIEAGSILLIREVLQASDHLGCISAAQAQAELAQDLVVALDVRADWPRRAIGLTHRTNWVPTRAQAEVMTLLRDEARG